MQRTFSSARDNRERARPFATPVKGSVGLGPVLPIVVELTRFAPFKTVPGGNATHVPIDKRAHNRTRAGAGLRSQSIFSSNPLVGPNDALLGPPFPVHAQPRQIRLSSGASAPMPPI